MINRLNELLFRLSNEIGKVSSQLKGGRTEPFTPSQDQAQRFDMAVPGETETTPAQAPAIPQGAAIEDERFASHWGGAAGERPISVTTQLSPLSHGGMAPEDSVRTSSFISAHDGGTQTVVYSSGGGAPYLAPPETNIAGAFQPNLEAGGPHLHLAEEPAAYSVPGTTSSIEVPMHSEPPVNHAPSPPALDNLVIDENAAGAIIGHLSASDPDIGDTVSFSVSDDRFEIVDNELKLKDGISFDHETNPSVNVTVYATDSGDSHPGEHLQSASAFTINIADVNEAPAATPIADQFALGGNGFSLDAASHFSDPDAGDTLTYSLTGPEWMTIDPHTGQIAGTPPDQGTILPLANGLYEISGTGTLTIDTKFFAAEAGYHNSVGYYLANSSGAPVAGGVINLDAHQLYSGTTEIDLSQFPDAHALGFFMVPNGANILPSGSESDLVGFAQTSSGWSVEWGSAGHVVTAYFSDTSLNADGLQHLTDSSAAGAFNWEDLFGGGDRDYNDANMDATVRYFDDHTQQVTVTATDHGGLSASTSFQISIGDAAGNSLHGTAGSDVMWGGGGNDEINGGAGDDTLYGGAGSDLFLYAAGDGHDHIDGGAGSGWTDVLHVTGVSEGLNANGAATDWMLQLDHGSIVSADAHSLTLSDDAQGSIVFHDGGSIVFHDIEKIEWA